jgi:hypothetical protein
MEKKQLAVVVAVLGVFCSAALAGAPLGPPRSLVEHGQWAVNFEYGYEEMDLYTYGRIHEYYVDGSSYCDSGVMEVKDLELNAFFGSLEYGLCDRWEVFLRVGIADAQDDIVPVFCARDDTDEVFNFDGDYGFAWGAGTKMTICQHGDWTFGGVIQVTWLYPDESDLNWVYPLDPNEVFEGEGDLDLRQIQAGLGATLDMDGWFLYGGICWFFMRGDMDFEGSFYDTGVEQLSLEATYHVDEQSEFGGWFGLGCQLETAVCFAEAQILEDYWLVGGGVKIPLP